MQTKTQEIDVIRQEFNDYYQETLQPHFAELEVLRKKYLHYFILLSLSIFGILPVIIFSLYSSANFQYIVTDNADILSGAGILLATFCSSPIYLFKSKTKNLVMPEFIKFFESFEYSSAKHITEEFIIKSRLFEKFNYSKGDDYFSGSYKNVHMIISEERLVCKTGYGRNRTIERIFNGIMIVLEMNKNFSGQTIGLEDKGIFNCFNKQTTQISGLEPVKLEDIVFEKEFEIYSDDQIESRYLLTTAFMERLLEVRKTYKGKCLKFSFFENKLVIAIDTKKDMFESSSLFMNTTDRRHIDEAFEQFISIMSIIDILKLNQRIGM